MAAPHRPRILACDLGGTQLRTAVVDAAGQVTQRRAVPTPKGDPGALPALLRDALAEADEVDGVVVGVPGPIDYAAGAPTMLVNLPAWEGHVSASILAGRLGLGVLLANDADLAALGEHRFGAGRGFDDVAYVTVSTGVGAGVVLGGRLVRGRLSLAELGHTIIDRHAMKTVEDLGSGTALGRIAGENAAAVSARAQEGDAEAAALFREAADALAVGVLNLVLLFSPQVVVIGGGMSQAGDLLLDPVRQAIAACPASSPAARALVVRAATGDDAGLKGAAAYWADERA